MNKIGVIIACLVLLAGASSVGYWLATSDNSPLNDDGKAVALTVLPEKDRSVAPTETPTANFVEPEVTEDYPSYNEDVSTTREDSEIPDEIYPQGNDNDAGAGEFDFDDIDLDVNDSDNVDIGEEQDFLDDPTQGNGKILIIEDGATEMPRDELQSTERAEKVFIPVSMKLVYDMELQYLQGGMDKKHTDIYYAGSEAQWDAIFEIYPMDGDFEMEWSFERLTSDEEYYTKKGEEAAFRANKRIGGPYDPNLFTFHFNASPDDVYAA